MSINILMPALSPTMTEGKLAKWHVKVGDTVTAGQVITSAMAAYAFARLKFPGRENIFFGYLATMMVPHSVTMIPNFIALRYLPDLLAGTLPFVAWDELRYLGTVPGAIPVGRLADALRAEQYAHFRGDRWLESHLQTSQPAAAVAHG